MSWMSWWFDLSLIIALAVCIAFMVVLLDKYGKLSMDNLQLRADAQRAWGLGESVADSLADRRITVSDTAYLARVHSQRLTPLPVTKLPVYRQRLRLPTT